MRWISLVLAVVLLLSWAHPAFAQDPLERAVLFYERGDIEGALQLDYET